MIIDWGGGSYIPGFQQYGLGSVPVVNSDVLFFINGDTMRNNRVSVFTGGRFQNKNYGQNIQVINTGILDTRFDDYQYYQDIPV